MEWLGLSLACYLIGAICAVACGGREAANRLGPAGALAGSLAGLAGVLLSPASAASHIVLPWGLPRAVAAVVGGLAIVVGALLAAWMAFGGGVLGAVSAVLRLVAGMVVKWVVVIGVLVVGAGLYKLPPLPLLAGVITGLVAQVLVATGKQR